MAPGLPPTHAGYARLVTALRALHAAADRAGGTAADSKMRQIAVNLERWRWLPRRFESRHLVVNTADATMAVIEDGKVRLASRVVVGDEIHPTPVVRSEMGAIVFNPTWTVPTSIVVDEFLPKLRANPRFLADNDIVILDRREDPYGVAIDWTAVPTTRFPFRLQQRPGGWNPLGRMRFATPNRLDVYLHDTPLPELFQRDDRALSHGCVRVERARDPGRPRAGRSADGRPDAPHARWRRAPSVVTVARPLPVYLLYWRPRRRRGSPPARGSTRTTATRAWPRGWPAPRSPPRPDGAGRISGSGQAAGTSAGERPPASDRRAVLRPRRARGDRALGAPGCRGRPGIRAARARVPESPRARASTSSTERTASWTTALREIDWVLRDFRPARRAADGSAALDLLWRLRTALETTEPYEDPATARPRPTPCLRREGRGVSRVSLHMQAMAADVRVPGCSLTALRDAAPALRLGGVGYYGPGLRPRRRRPRPLLVSR
jgi:hypothetical protein